MINNNDNVICCIDSEVKAAFIAEHARKNQIARGLSEEERFHIFSMGYYNCAVKGYLMEGLKNAGFNQKDINKALDGLCEAMSEYSPKEAEEIYIKS